MKNQYANYEAMLQGGSWAAKDVAEKAKLLHSLLVHVEATRSGMAPPPNNDRFQKLFFKIAEWKEKRETEYYDDEGYCQMLHDMYFDVLNAPDNGCSSGTHDAYAWLETMILLAYKQDQEMRKQRIKENLERAQAEVKRLEKEAKGLGL